MLSWNLILPMVVYCCCAVVNSRHFIQKIISGNLSQPWNINVTLFAKDLRGILLYCVDSDLNKVSIRVTVAVNHKKYFQLSYNNGFSRSQLQQTCGCDSCDDKMMNLYLESINGSIFVECNKYGRDSLIKLNNKDSIPSLIQQEIANSTNSIFIGMGNVDEADDLIGCLSTFYFNKTQLKFKVTGNEFMPACKVKCVDPMCNKGKCGPSYPPGPFCDCSNTPLNGRYCNRTLKVYNKSENHSFQRRSLLQQVQFKFTWKAASKKTHCLMELIYGEENIVFSVTEEHMLRNSDIMSIIAWGEVNFINVNITNSDMKIRILGTNSLIQLPLARRFRVNFGFSESKANCEPFEGIYDLRYNRSQLVRVANQDKGKMNIMWILIPVLVVFLTIISAGVALFFLKIKKKDVSQGENETIKFDPDQGSLLPADESAKL